MLRVDVLNLGKKSIHDEFNIITGEFESFDYSNPKWCFGGKGGGGTNTVTQSSQPPQYVADAYQALLAQANQVAATPFSQPTQPVAPLTANQNAGINSVAGAAGSTQPYTNMGVAAANAGSQAIWPNLPTASAANINSYMSPYSQDVIDATQKQLNQNDAAQQSQLRGSAIQSGASPFGGDRAGVAAATLAGQQDLANNQTIAGLYNQNYTQALNELNNQQNLQANTQSSDAWRQLSAAQLYPSIGTTAQTNTLNQASAQEQAGALQQAQSQNDLNAPYNEILAQLAYPFQTTQFLGGLTEGIGSGSGGTGTTTSPGPSTASQLGGLGLSGFALNQALPQGYGLMEGLSSLFAKRGGVARARLSNGGRPHYDFGGAIGIPNIPDVMVSVVPSASTQRSGNGPPGAPRPDQQQNPSASSSLASGANIGKLFFSSGGGGSSGDTPGFGNILQGLTGNGNSASGYVNSSPASQVGSDVAAEGANSGIGDFLSNIGDFFKRGGIAHYDAGGSTNPGIQMQSPQTQASYAQYANLPVEKLQQLAVMQPNNPMIQKALQMKRMGTSSAPVAQGVAGAVPQMNMRNGGRAKYAIGGEILPDIVSGVGDIVGAFFGMPGAGDTGVSMLSNIDGGRTGGDGVEHRAIGSLMGEDNSEGGFYRGGRTHYDNGGYVNDIGARTDVSFDELLNAMPKGVTPDWNGPTVLYSNSDDVPVPQRKPPVPKKPKFVGIGESEPDFKKGGVAKYATDGYVDNDPATQVLQDIAEDDQATNGYGAAGPPSANNATPQGVSSVNASDLLPPDAQGIALPAKSTDIPTPMPSSTETGSDLDNKPVVDHSGDTVKVHYPSEGKSVDTGIPSMKDNTTASSAWLPVLSAGLAMMAGKSPHALTNIGEGGLAGVKTLEEQREAALNESKAQVEQQKIADDLDLRRQQMAQESSQFNTKQTTMTPYERAEIDRANKQLTQDQWQVIPDQMGGFLKYNKKTGETQTMAGASGSMAPAIDSKTGQPLTGDAYLATLTPENAAQIKAMDEGRLNFPAGFALKSPYWQQKLSQLYQYNPGASQQTAAAVKAFNQGKHGDQMRSLNVAVNHLDLLDNLTGALGNRDVTALNTVGNLWKSQTGSPAPTNFDTAKQIVGDEVTKAVIGAGGTGADRDKAQSVIDKANSPEQLRGAIQTYKQLMTGQLGGLKQQYENSTGHKDFDKYLTPAAKTALMPPQQSPSDGASAIPPIDQRVKGKTYTNPNGHSAVWTGTGWSTP